MNYTGGGVSVYRFDVCTPGADVCGVMRSHPKRSSRRSATCAVLRLTPASAAIVLTEGQTSALRLRPFE